MDEKYIIEKLEKAIEELHNEYADYNGQYQLLTHIINLEFLMGKYFGCIELLEKTIPYSENVFDCEYIKIYERDRKFIEVVSEYVNKQYGKLREV